MWGVHEWTDLATRIVFACSLLHTILPPWEAFSDFPELQKRYKLFVYLVGWCALSGRSTLYKSISTQDGRTTSQAAETGKIEWRKTNGRTE